MDIQVYAAPGALYIKSRGRIVLEDCEIFKNKVYPLFREALAQVAIDLEEADFIDSAGLGALVGLKTRANQNNARFVLVSPSRPIEEILNISKLVTIFDILTGLDAKTLRATLARPEHLIPG
jgi:anti-sigma B factor antagonist